MKREDHEVRCTSPIAVLAVVAVVAFAASDASATYHPAIGRFLQRDPGPSGLMRIGAGGAAPLGRFVPRDSSQQYRDGTNLHAYVRSNPMRNVDPLGLAKLQVDQTLNVGGSYDFDDLEKVCKDSFNEININDYADEDEILDEHLDKMGTTDVWVYFGHSGLSPKTNRVEYIFEHDSLFKVLWMGNDPIHVNNLVKKMTSGNKKHAPGLVVLGGCRSCEMANKFVSSGSKCVLCAHVEFAAGNGARIVNDFFKSACSRKNGKHEHTLRQAFDKAMAAQQTYFNLAFAGKSVSEIMELRCPGGDDARTLDGITGK